MSTDNMNIDAFRGQAPAGAFAVLDPNAESLADGIGSSYGIIGYKGKVWSLRHRGVTHQFTRADDGSPSAFLDVIVLRSAPYKSKSHYPPGSFVDGAMGTRPLCAALNGETPDVDILTPQSSTCALCPKNIFKTSPDGRKSKDCSDYKRLSVLILPSQTKPLFGAPLMEPVFLRVPAASLNDLALLGEGMTARGFHYSTYITRIGFNPEKPHPQMTFRALQKLEDREAAMVLPMREDAISIRITGETDVKLGPKVGVPTAPDAAIVAEAAAREKAKADAAALAAQLAAAAAAKAAKEAAEKAAQLAAAERAVVDTGFGDVSPPTTANGVVDTGFGTATHSEPTQVLNGAQVASVVSDTGAPVEGDPDLDARVAALFPKL